MEQPERVAYIMLCDIVTSLANGSKPRMPDGSFPDLEKDTRGSSVLHLEVAYRANTTVKDSKHITFQNYIETRQITALERRIERVAVGSESPAHFTVCGTQE